MIRNLRPQNIFSHFGIPPGFSDDQGFNPEDIVFNQDYGPQKEFDPPFPQTYGPQQEGYLPPLESGQFTPNYSLGDLPPGIPPQNPEAAQYFRQEMMDVPPQPEESIYDRLNRDYEPRTAANDRFEQLINQYPQYQKPGFGTKLAASMAALGNIRMRQPGGPEAADRVLYGQHARQVADWKAQAEPAYQAANLERYENVNERQLRAQAIQAQVAQNRIDEAARKATADLAEKERAAKAKEETERRKVQLISEKQNGTEFIVTPAGKIFAKRLDGTIYDTGEDAKNYTAIEIANITAKSRVDAANTAATNAPPQMFTVKQPDGTDKVFRYNQATQKMEPVMVEGQQATDMTKVGTGKGTLKQPVNIEAIQNSARETLLVMDELLDKENKLKPEIKGVMGYGQWNPTRFLPESEGLKASATINRLKSRLIVDLIAEMKSQSKTGATGFGQLNIRELEVLESAASKLDPALGDVAFTAELNRIKEKLQKILLPADGLNPTNTTVPKKLTPAELRKKYGG